MTFENVQAGLRTDYLFRLANRHNALVVGTGDLSELALGWCTYGVGDHMSHYNPNSGVPKTLIQHLIRFAAGPPKSATPPRPSCAISLGDRNLAGTGAGRRDRQAAGDGGFRRSLGALQDFTLFHMTRSGAAPSKIAWLAHVARGDATRGGWPDDKPPAERKAYDVAEIKRWLRFFLTRFFANQFKRSAVPNGPKICRAARCRRAATGACRPTRADVWLAELDANTPD